jgi:hypothetical protein
VDQAWETALRACNDFLKDGNEIDIVFAVLSDSVLEIGQNELKKLQ